MTWEYRCIGIKIQVKGTDYGYHMRVNMEGSHGKKAILNTTSFWPKPRMSWGHLESSEADQEG